MNSPALLIQFDAETWTPTGIFPIAGTNEQQAWLRMLAERMIEALPKVEVSEA